MLGVLDAVYLGEPGVLEARQRLTLRMREAEQGQRRLPARVGPATQRRCCGARRDRRPRTRLRVSRAGLAAMRLAARGGARYAVNAPRLFAAAGRAPPAAARRPGAADRPGRGRHARHHEGRADEDRASSPATSTTASPRRPAGSLGRLQDSVPPMSPELAAGVIAEELGGAARAGLREWDPLPIAAASIGQVHRAITARRPRRRGQGAVPGHRRDDRGRPGQRRAAPLAAEDGRAQPGRRRADRRSCASGSPRSSTTGARRDNQRPFAAYFDGHPTIRVPRIVDELSTARVITSELADGARFAELPTWPQAERDLAAETIYRFTFRSAVRGCTPSTATRTRATTCSSRGGRVTFLDFGLVKHFTDEELDAAGRDGRGVCAWTMTPRGSAGPWRGPASWIPDAPIPRRRSWSTWRCSTTPSASAARAP